MELETLKNRIGEALKECQRIIERNPYAVNNESDFERLVCNCIESQLKFDIKNNPKVGSFYVNTQTLHRNEITKKKVFVDIHIKKVEKCNPDLIGKKVAYRGPSIALELKYLHIGHTAKCVKNDFEKIKQMENNDTIKSWLFVVVLVDSRKQGRISLYEKKKDEIEKMYNEYNSYHNCLFYKVLKKEF